METQVEGRDRVQDPVPLLLIPPEAEPHGWDPLYPNHASPTHPDPVLSTPGLVSVTYKQNGLNTSRTGWPKPVELAPWFFMTKKACGNVPDQRSLKRRGLGMAGADR